MTEQQITDRFKNEGVRKSDAASWFNPANAAARKAFVNAMRGKRYVSTVLDSWSWFLLGWSSYDPGATGE